MKVDLDLSNYAKADLTNLNLDVDKLDINKLKNVPSDLNSLKSKVDKLDLDKLVRVPRDLSELSHVVKNDVVKKDEYNGKIKDKIPNVSDLVKKADYDAEKEDIKKKYFTTSNYDKFLNNIPDVKITPKKLVKESGLNRNIKTLAQGSYAFSKKLFPDFS